MSLTAVAPARNVRAAVKIRPSVAQMTPAQLTRFRTALQTMMDRPDDRGFQFYAGWHGVPKQLCTHWEQREFFLPWHRGYLYHFELALQDIDPEVTLPWWDWMERPGLPEAYAKQRVGNRKNPLYESKIAPIGVTPRRDWPKKTYRRVGSITGPNKPIPPPFKQSHWNWLMVEPTTYDEFSRRCEMLHDNMHRWIAGTMGLQDWAAFDPIFWAHHTMVDRLWSIWQGKQQGRNPPPTIIDRPMTFGKAPALTPRQVLEVGSLGYEYAGLTASVPF